MFWGIMIPMIILLITMIVVGEERFNKWFRCSHDWKIRSSYLNKNEVAVCQKCGRKEIIKEEE